MSAGEFKTRCLAFMDDVREGGGEYVENVPGWFSRRVVPLVERAVQRGSVVISAISVWEVAMLDPLESTVDAGDTLSTRISGRR